ncbi:MAG: phosphoribosyltransferase family protein [Synergistaceae bacterium]|nr:phosphoribosyltransferase family protein [Synergistaceae bacterium]
MPPCSGAFPCYFASVYDGYAKQFLLNLKYRNSRSLGVPMGRLMGRLFEKTEAEVILPVPLHINSSRAFNQTELLAKGISEEQGIPVEDMLVWSDDFGRQVEKKAGERKALPENAIDCRPLFGKKVLLVDDVYTTGSTVRSAGKAVRRAGGKVVAAYFWSRSVRRKSSDEFDDIIDALSLEIG